MNAGIYSEQQPLCTQSLRRVSIFCCFQVLLHDPLSPLCAPLLQVTDTRILLESIIDRHAGGACPRVSFRDRVRADLEVTTTMMQSPPACCI